MPAYRNIRLCGKDCLCLYVCPSGATDTENSIIDVTKCLPGCTACADACPSGAISIVPDEYPPQQPKAEPVLAAQRALARSKTRQERIAATVAASAQSPVQRQFAEAIAKSARLMAEDLFREAGNMLPQSGEAHALLEEIGKSDVPDSVKGAVDLLQKRLKGRR